MRPDRRSRVCWYLLVVQDTMKARRCVCTRSFLRRIRLELMVSPQLVGSGVAHHAWRGLQYRVCHLSGTLVQLPLFPSRRNCLSVFIQPHEQDFGSCIDGVAPILISFQSSFPCHGRDEELPHLYHYNGDGCTTAPRFPRSYFAWRPGLGYRGSSFGPRSPRTQKKEKEKFLLAKLWMAQ